jgi:hypothetical protein
MSAGDSSAQFPKKSRNWLSVALSSLVVVALVAFAFIGTSPNGTSLSGTDARCNFSPSVMTLANQIQSLPKFIQLEDGANYTLVSAYQSGGVETAYIGGTIMANGAVSYATTTYYPPDWFFWFMPPPTYCTIGGSWVGVPFIRATVNLNPDGGFNLTSVGFYHGTFYPNGTN